MNQTLLHDRVDQILLNNTNIHSTKIYHFRIEWNIMKIPTIAHFRTIFPIFGHFNPRLLFDQSGSKLLWVNSVFQTADGAFNRTDQSYWAGRTSGIDRGYQLRRAQTSDEDIVLMVIGEDTSTRNSERQVFHDLPPIKY